MANKTDITFKELNEMIVFGLDENDDFVYIDDCENGLSCNLVCPFCKSRLNAKNGGTMVAHHFAHAKGSDCKKGHETTLSLMIIDTLNKNKYLYYPYGTIKFAGTSLNQNGNARIKQTKLMRVDDSTPYFVEAVTEQNKTIAIVPFFYDYHFDLVAIKRLYENVITIDFESYKHSDKSVREVVEESIKKHSIFKRWDKRYDDYLLAKRIYEVAFWKSYGKDRNGFEVFYCPKDKIIKVDSSQCSGCDYELRNIVKDYYNYTNLGHSCLGYLDEINRKTLLDKNIQIPTNFPDEPLMLLRKYKHGGHEWFYLNDIPLFFPKQRFALIYNFRLNRCFQIDFENKKDNWYCGEEIDFNGNPTSLTIEIPREHDGYWRIVVLNIFNGDIKYNKRNY